MGECGVEVQELEEEQVGGGDRVDQPLPPTGPVLAAQLGQGGGVEDDGKVGAEVGQNGDQKQEHDSTRRSCRVIHLIPPDCPRQLTTATAPAALLNGIPEQPLSDADHDGVVRTNKSHRGRVGCPLPPAGRNRLGRRDPVRWRCRVFWCPRTALYRSADEAGEEGEKKPDGSPSTGRDRPTGTGGSPRCSPGGLDGGRPDGCVGQEGAHEFFHTYAA